MGTAIAVGCDTPPALELSDHILDLVASCCIRSSVGGFSLPDRTPPEHLTIAGRLNDIDDPGDDPKVTNTRSNARPGKVWLDPIVISAMSARNALSWADTSCQQKIKFPALSARKRTYFDPITITRCSLNC